MTPGEHRALYPERWIQLTPEELARCEALALARQAEGAKRQDRLGTPELASHMKGALGEFIVAKFYGFPEPRHGLDFGTPDHGRDIGTRAMIGWSAAMPVKPQDSDLWMVGVTLFPPGAGVVRGYYRTRAAQTRLDWKKDPGQRGPAFFVPLDALLNPETLETAEILR